MRPMKYIRARVLAVKIIVRKGVKMKNRFKCFCSALVIVLVNFVACHGAYAEGIRAGLTVTPPNQKVVLTPGETYNGSIKVSNPAGSDRDVEYAVAVVSFSEYGADGSKDDYGNVDFVSKTNYNQMVDWITLDNAAGSLSPNETTVVQYSINVPKDAPAGGQYAALSVRDITGSVTMGDGVAVNNIVQILSIIYAEVLGETRTEGVILENEMPNFLTNGHLEAMSRVRNNGNVHTDATWTLQVWPLFSNEEICTNEEKPSSSLVMPETEKFHTEECNLPMVGIFRAKQTVTIFGETDILEKTIIVCPIWLLFIIIFVVVALIIWIVLRVKGHKGSRAKAEE